MEGSKLITSAYDFIKWAIPHIVKLPGNQGNNFGESGDPKKA